MSDGKRVETGQHPGPGCPGPASASLPQVSSQLRDLITNLRTDQARHEGRSMTPSPGFLAAVTPAPGPPPERPASARAPDPFVEAHLAQAREAVERTAFERDRLARRVGLLEEENRRLAAALVAAQREIIALTAG
jgi:hypothetical protein